MVQLGFLMVGHTHEDIDALFSHFSEEIRTTQVFSFPHLMQKFNQCTQSHPAPDRKSTRLNSSHSGESRMPSSA